MSFNVDFYTFSKKTNSTLRPYASANVSLNCVLKENTSIVNPTLIIYNTENFNPYSINYCYISTFARYYFVNDWRYIVGQWECDCVIDALATYKTQISNAYKYVLRSAKRKNINMVDELYPSLAWKPNDYIDTADFQFYRTITYGKFIVGIANLDSSNFSAVSYYLLSNSNIRGLIQYMLQPAQEMWQNLNSFTDTIIRSIYGPFDYIKSCKWFAPPITSPETSIPLSFGNYTSNVYGQPLSNDVSDWYTNQRDLYLPQTWLSLEAKYRTNPYAHIYILCNPWGVFELNPLDFTDSRQVRLKLYVDYVSGEGILKIYKVVGTTEYFITQKKAMISIDIPLTQSMLNVGGVFGGLLSAGAGIASIAASGGATAPIIAGSVQVLSGVSNAAVASYPTISNISGQSFNNIVSMDGVASLIYQSSYFAADCPDEKGYPLCNNETLNDLRKDSNNSGYILCLDGDIDITGAYKQELDIISSHMTEGFYLE